MIGYYDAAARPALNRFPAPACGLALRAGVGAARPFLAAIIIQGMYRGGSYGGQCS